MFLFFCSVYGVGKYRRKLRRIATPKKRRRKLRRIATPKQSNLVKFREEGGRYLPFPPCNLLKIAKHTENFSARDLKALVQEARQQTVLDLKRASKWRKMRPHPSNENLDYALVPLQSGSVGSQTGEIVEMTFAEAKVDKAVSVRLILPPMELEHFTRALERHPVVVPSRDLKRLDAWSKGK